MHLLCINNVSKSFDVCVSLCTCLHGETHRDRFDFIKLISIQCSHLFWDTFWNVKLSLFFFSVPNNSSGLPQRLPKNHLNAILNDEFNFGWVFISSYCHYHHGYCDVYYHAKYQNFAEKYWQVLDGLDIHSALRMNSDHFENPLTFLPALILWNISTSTQQFAHFSDPLDHPKNFWIPVDLWMNCNNFGVPKFSSRALPCEAALFARSQIRLPWSHTYNCSTDQRPMWNYWQVQVVV